MKTYTNTIRTLKGSFKGERMQIKAFKTSEDMHNFLNTGDNSLNWRETIDQTKTHPNTYGAFNEKTLKPGKYAWAGGAWHNVKSLDSSVLAHI